MLFLSILISFVIALFAAWLVYRADKKKRVPYPIATATLRAILFFGLCLLLFAPQIEKRTLETLKPIVVFLQDNSQSVEKSLGKEKDIYLANLEKLSQSLASNYRIITWNLDGPINADSLGKFALEQTNLSMPLERITDLYGNQNIGAIVVASDGWYNQGNNPLFNSIPINGSVYTIALGDTNQKQDIRIGKIYANKTSTINSEWQIRADIIALKCAQSSSKVELLDANGRILSSNPLNITQERFDASVSFSVRMDKSGLQQYSLRIPKIGNEQNVENNQTSIVVEVLAEKKKILLLSAAPHPDIHAIKQALAGLNQYELQLKSAAEIGSINANDYAAIVLHQLPSNNTPIPETFYKAKNVWYIAGNQTNYNTLNRCQSLVQFNTGLNPRNVAVVYDKNFSLFNLAANSASVIDQYPPLFVSASDWRCDNRGNNLLMSNTNQALWCLQPGINNTAVLCGEGLWRWRMHEYKNTKEQKVIDECIRQTINFLTANNKNKAFRTELPKYVWSNSEIVQISAFLYNANNELVNASDATLSIKDSNGLTKNYSFERSGSSYRLTLGALPPGNYTYVANTTFNGKTFSDQGKFLVNNISLEQMEDGCNYPFLYALASKNKGQTFDVKSMQYLSDSILKNNNIKTLLNEQTESVAIIDWRWIFFVLLLVATAEWLLRKYWMAM